MHSSLVTSTFDVTLFAEESINPESIVIALLQELHFTWDLYEGVVTRLKPYENII